MLTARLTSIRLRNVNLTSIFNALIMRNDRVDWSSVGIVSCHLVSLSIVKFMTLRRWENNKFECRICHQVIKSNLIPDMLQKFYIYNLYLTNEWHLS
ncbi:hypothetical protein T06_8466 [Trichinella sp. T6]|nr:hypothetical protein T06_8466 [Trichinella sp. T6]